jgi:hypothetical protein
MITEASIITIANDAAADEIQEAVATAEQELV